jgi:hypothetical protein
MARILFRACRSQVRRYLAKSTAYMLLSTGPSMKSGLLNFPLVKTLPSPREHNRKMVASQHWCWSLEPLLQALVPLQLVRLWGHIPRCVVPASPVFIAMVPILQVFGLFTFFYRDRSTWRYALGKRSNLNNAVQWDECFHLCPLAILLHVPFLASALLFTLITLSVGT